MSPFAQLLVPWERAWERALNYSLLCCRWNVNETEEQTTWRSCTVTPSETNVWLQRDLCGISAANACFLKYSKTVSDSLPHNPMQFMHLERTNLLAQANPKHSNLAIICGSLNIFQHSKMGYGELQGCVWGLCQNGVISVVSVHCWIGVQLHRPVGAACSAYPANTVL